MLSLFLFGPVSASELVNRLNPTFSRINTTQGLSQSTVNVIFQDSTGIIWVGTIEGLNSYDGEKFEQFFSSSAANSLSNDYVSAIIEDADGVLWIGTDNGLNAFDGVRSIFSQVDLDESESGFAADHSSIRSLFIDTQSRLWVGTGRGMARRAVNGSFIHYHHSPDDPETLGEGGVRAIAEDSQGNIWIGTDSSGLSRLNPETGTIDRFEREFSDSGLKDNSIRDLMVDRNGTLWVATFNGGLWRVETKSLAFEYIPLVSREGLVTSRVRSLLNDSANRIWAGTDEGLFLVDAESETSSNFAHQPTDSTSLSQNIVLDLFEDAGGVIWAATWNGISKWNSRAPKFSLYRSDKDTNQELAGDSITSFIEDEETLWVGTLTGLSAYDKSLARFRLVSEIELADPRVMTLAVEKGDLSTLWIGSMSGGLTSYSGNTQRNFTVTNDSESIASNQISKVFVDSKGRVWVGLYGTGVDLYLGEKRFKHYPRQGADFSDLRITDIEEDDEGKIWISSNGGGLMILDAERDITRVVRHEPDAENTIASDNLVSVSKGKTGIWVGARDAGVSFIDPVTLKVKRITKSDGLSSVAAYGVLEDASGSVWISGGKGLSVLAESENLEIYDASHGLQANDFNSGAYLKMKDGTFLYGGNSGFNAFDPLRIHPSTFNPPVQLTGFKKSNESVVFKRPWGELNDIEIEHDDYVIAFEYGAMDYASPARNQYEYFLDGFDSGWVSAGNERAVTYTNLDPGQYTFRVRATNSDGVWSDQTVAVGLRVAPPLYATWWAYIGYCIFLVMLLTASYRQNSRKMSRIAEDSHRARLEKYVQTLEQATDAIAIASENGLIEYRNELFSTLFDSPRVGAEDEPVGGKLLETLFDSESDRAEVTARVAESGRFSTEVARELSVTKYYEISVARTEFQGVVTLIAIARDITQRKETERQLEHYSRNLEQLVDERTSKLEEEVDKSILHQKALENSLVEKELLIKEVHHRVKNNMQVISSLLSIQAEGAGDEVYSSLLNESQQRIKSMALIHETLYQSKDLLKIDFQEYIESLTNSLSRSYTVPGVSVFVDVTVENVLLDLATAVPCGLVINELVSNALKHAFHDKEETGIIDIDFVSTDCSYDLRIADNGVGLPSGFDLSKNTSMGLEIVTILTDQLEGTLSAYNDGGAVFQIQFPRILNE